MEIEQRILKFVTLTNWVLLAAVSLLGFAVASTPFALGVLLGGLLVTVNFHLLYRTLRTSFGSPGAASVGAVLAKYYVRFVASGVIIFFLISRHIVQPFGLFIGLSVVVASIMLVTVCEFGKLILKEAA